MKQEIERKFLVTGEGWRGKGAATELVQGYLCNSRERSVRVRISGSSASLTVKGESRGAVRLEYEYEIPLADARELIDALCRRPPIEKTRHKFEQDSLTWEVDEFRGANAGLVLAEVELEREDQPLELPDWVGREVTDDPRYYNANLAHTPYRAWREQAAGESSD